MSRDWGLRDRRSILRVWAEADFDVFSRSGSKRRRCRIERSEKMRWVDYRLDRHVFAG